MWRTINKKSRKFIEYFEKNYGIDAKVFKPERWLQWEYRKYLIIQNQLRE